MIRPATRADAQAVADVAVDSGLFPADDAGIVTTMMADYFATNSDEGHLCIIDEEDEPLAVAYYQAAPAADRTWYLTMIAVRLSRQGQGRGATLLRHVEDDLRARGQRLLLVETSGLSTFRRTRAFYESCGYEEEARVRDYYEPGDDMILLRKALQRVSDIDDSDQAVGHLVPGWTARSRPAARPMAGRFCRLEPLDPAHHADDLYRANRADEKGRMWTYLSYGPFDSLTSYRAWLLAVAGRDDPMFFAIIDGDGQAVGVASFLRIDPSAGTIEVGHLAFSPAVQATTAATEAMALMMRTVFDELGYRRYEWKCDSLNAASRRAAQRLGFVYEGTFRQAVVVKGRNRDTAWFSITDAEWPRLAAAYDRWLAPDNFDAQGRQRMALSKLTLRDSPLAP